MIITSRKKIIFNVGAMIVSVLVIVCLIIFPTVRNIQKTTEETSKLRAYLEKQYQQSINARLTKQKVDEIKLESSSFSSYLFKAQYTLDFIQTLENMANKNKVSQSINSSDLDKIAPGQNIKLSITASGEYANVLKYLYDLENLPYFLNPDQISIAPAYSRENNSQQVNLSLILSLYVNK